MLDKHQPDFVTMEILFILAPVLLAALLLFRNKALAKDNRALTKDNRALTKDNRALRDKYSSNINLDATVAKQENKLKYLQEDYKKKKLLYDDLRAEAAIYDEQIAFAELGVYKPHFEYDDSDQFKSRIDAVRARQKAMVSANSALICETDWNVDGSRVKGKQMANRAIKLSLRAFNNECDAAIANTRWNNATSMEKRIQRAYDAIEKLNQSLNIQIDEEYYSLKLEEFWLTHEYREKRKEEKDREREMRQLQREEEKFQKDAERARKEEEKYTKLLDKARKEVGLDEETYIQKINELTQKLNEAHEQSERAKSMAEQTRAGFIYVISNIGSFGDNVYKIGMTRRLDPRLRIIELGDASVPFRFDTHIIFYCLDAPSVENELHRAFNDERVNAINMRKEFFAVSLQKITEKVWEIDPSAEVISTPEAEEYQKTLLLREQLAQDANLVNNKFPNNI